MKAVWRAFMSFFGRNLKATASEVREAYRFEGVVEKVIIIHEYEGMAILAHFDPSFVFIVGNIKALDGEMPDVDEGRLTYCIHSVALTFRTDDPVGKKFIFHVSRDGKAWSLEAKPVR